jgi:hypothetical protein
MYRAAPYLNRATGLPDVWRKEKHLRYLNACYVDLDVGRPESAIPEQRTTWWQAVAVAGELMDNGELPYASIFAKSGRGVYLFWLLRDPHNPNAPQRYWPEKLTLYKMVNRAIGSRLAALAPDRAAHDAARVLRVPGTLHAKTKHPATYLIPTTASGQPYTYTLSELAEFFGVAETEASLPEATRQDSLIVTAHKYLGRETKALGSQPNRVKGRIQLNAQRAQDLVTLEQYRQGWTKGQRHFCLDLYAQFLRLAGNAPQDTLEALETMAANCKPPYPSDPNDPRLTRIVEHAYASTPKRHLNASLVRWLRITPELARALELLTILPPEVAAERQPPAGGRRAADREARRDYIRRYLEQHRDVTARGMTNALLNAGHATNRQTVNQDLNALGHVVRGRGRPKVAK